MIAVNGGSAETSLTLTVVSGWSQ